MSAEKTRQVLEIEDRRARKQGVFPRSSEVFPVEIAVVETHGEEIEEIGDDCLGSLGFKQVDQVIVRQRHELDEDLADDADPRFAFGLL